jgi:uncharacterized membrane protein
MLLVFAFAIGIISGLRTFTGIAAVSWAAHLKWLDLSASRLSFLGSTVAVCIISLLAIAELVMDKLPSTPNRTSIGPLIGRIVIGGLCGAALFASTSNSVWTGAFVGALGAIAGTFAGYEIRKRIVSKLQVKDLVVAIAEDLVAIVGAFLLVSRI